MSKNILVVQSCTNQPIYEISLEVIEKEIRNGNNVTILSCNGVLPTCLVNPYHHKSICSECLYRQKHGLRLLSKKINQVQLNITKTIETLNLSCNLDDLLKVQIDSVKLGKAFAAFYTCTHFSSYGINLNKAFLSQIYSQYYIWFQNFLTIANSFDEFYIHNGRFPIDKAIIDFCITNSKTFFCYDTADVKNRYVLPKNVPIHDISYIKKQMQLLWSKANSEDKELIGNSFFKNRRYHIQNDSHSFTKHQVLNALPQDLDNRKELITIFNSTAEEVFTVDGFEYNLFNNEKEGLELILQHYQNDNTKQFIIRVHPHLSNCDNYQTQYLYELPKKYLNLLLIRPEEKIDTYALMQVSSKIIVLNSTMGIESAYWNKPVILLGRAYYEDLECIYKPKSQKDLWDLINLKNLKPLKNNLIPIYGYWDLNYGEEYEYCVAKSIGSVYFKNRNINKPHYFFWIKVLLSRIVPNSLKKKIKKAIHK